MKRPLTGALAAATVALALGACSDDQQDYASVGPAVDPCASYGSCGTCTPIPGCGWCFAAGPHGSCSSDPGTCSPGAASWTWDPSGCPRLADPTVVTDASPGAPDSGPDATATPP